MNINSVQDLNELIRNAVEESTELEYKSNFAMDNPHWKEELAKDVSGMANANGGILIYGIKEKKRNGANSVPQKLTPIANSVMSSDRLAQLIDSGIRPKIDNVEIRYIPCDDNSGCYVLTIPQGYTAHQNHLNHLYFKRHNAVVEVMDDYEIRDVMNRAKHPKVKLELKLVRKTTTTITKYFPDLITKQRGQERTATETDFFLNYRFFNSGQVYAQYINCFLYLPVSVLENANDYIIENEYARIYLDNTVQDILGFDHAQRKYGPKRYDPVLPQCYSYTESILLNFDDVDVKDLPPIRYEMFADNSEVIIDILEWDEIEWVNEDGGTKIIDLANPIF